MQRFVETADAIAGTTSKLKKVSFLAGYLSTLSEDDLRAAAVFFTGRPFALTDARTLNVGWSALMNAVAGSSFHKPVSGSNRGSRTGVLTAFAIVSSTHSNVTLLITCPGKSRTPRPP